MAQELGHRSPCVSCKLVPNVMFKSGYDKCAMQLCIRFPRTSELPFKEFPQMQRKQKNIDSETSSYSRGILHHQQECSAKTQPTDLTHRSAIS